MSHDVSCGSCFNIHDAFARGLFRNRPTSDLIDMIRSGSCLIENDPQKVAIPAMMAIAILLPGWRFDPLHAQLHLLHPGLARGMAGHVAQHGTPRYAGANGC